MAFFDNTRKPTGLGGRIMVSMMNIGHRSLADWGLKYLKLNNDANVLDCGCGGGANIKKLLKLCSELADGNKNQSICRNIAEIANEKPAPSSENYTDSNLNRNAGKCNCNYLNELQQKTYCVTTEVMK